LLKPAAALHLHNQPSHDISISNPKMPAPRTIASGRPKASKGVIGSTYDALTSSENASVVRGITAFGVR